MGFLENIRSAVTEIKTSESGPLVAMHNLGRPVWTPRDYENFAREGYIKQVIVYRTIRTIVTAASCVPWTLFRGQREIEEHPLLSLWNKPNVQMAQSEFIETVVGFYLVAGNSYVEAAGPERGPPTELWPQRPDRMRVIAGPFGLPSGFEYKVGSKVKRWSVDPATGKGSILHLKTFHPVNDWYGLSPIEAAAVSIDLRNEAGNWNKSLLQNSGRPSGAIVFDPKDKTAALTDDQFARLKVEIDRQYTGARNAGRPMLLDGGLKWEQMGLSPKDMDWLEASNASARDIAQALGVPPLLLGIPGDNRHSNYAEARLALWEETVIPLLDNFAGEFNAWLGPMFGQDLELRFNLDGISAFAPRRQKLWEMAANSGDFLTLNERRNLIGFEDIDGGDVILGPITSVPLVGENVTPPTQEERAQALLDVSIPEGGVTPEFAQTLWQEAYGSLDPGRGNGQAS